jgi:NADPH:quinone reductase-like Zn-dependent oxidoreductase
MIETTELSQITFADVNDGFANSHHFELAKNLKNVGFYFCSFHSWRDNLNNERCSSKRISLVVPIPIFHNFPKPKIEHPNHILLQVLASAINPVDYKLPRPFAPSEVYGIDVCGRIVEVGSSVTQWSVGDVVFGKGLGSLAEFCIADANQVTKIPDWLTPHEAAAIPVAYLTAVTGWNRVSILSKSDFTDYTMVIIGASGGCGLAAAQLATGLGVKRIVGICSSKNADYVKDCGGVTEVLDYNDEVAMKAFLDANAGTIDHVYDAASYSGGQGIQDYHQWSLQLLKENSGNYIALNGSVGSFFRYFVLGGTGFRDSRQTLHLTTFSTTDLQRVLELLMKAELKPDVNIMTFSQEGCEAGFNLLRSRRTKGKIVYDVSKMIES